MTRPLIQFLLPLILLVLLTISGVNFSLTEASPSNDNTSTETPINHIIVFMQGRHSFDNYFGTFPNADGFPNGTRIPANPFNPNNSAFVEPFHFDEKRSYSPNDDPETYRLSYNNGNMNGFVYANREDFNGSYVMGYFDDSKIHNYWKFASEYVLAQRFFGPSLRSDLVNSLYGIGAKTSLDLKDIPKQGLLINNTIFDELQNSNVSWKVYIEDYTNIRNMSNEERENLAKRIPILAIPRFIGNQSLGSHIDELSQYFRDIRNNNLPEVVFVYFTESHDSRTSKVERGQLLVSTLVYSLMKSHYWNNSAAILTYYESGGWYDHVKPPINNNTNEPYGFRVPAIFISPYAKQGFIDNSTYDMSSVLKFIVSSLGIKANSEMINKSSNILEAFDFTKPPRAPIYLEEITRERILLTSNNTGGINAVYAITLLVPIFVTIYWYYNKGRIKIR